MFSYGTTKESEAFSPAQTEKQITLLKSQKPKFFLEYKVPDN